MQYMAFESHKHDTFARVEDADGRQTREARMAHQRGALQRFPASCEPGALVAVETISHWYWIVDETEAASCEPKLVHAHQAKLMIGMSNQTDTLEGRGLNRLQRPGSLPAVWMLWGELREPHEVPRTRMVVVRQRTRLTTRVLATLAKPGLTLPAVNDRFARCRRQLL